MRGLRTAAVALCLLAAVALAATLAWRHLGTWLQAPGVAPAAVAPADVIVILGGDSGARTLQGLALWRARKAPAILLTGEEGSPPDARMHYLSWRAAILADGGVPANAIVSDAASENSWQEAVNARTLMRKRGWHRAIVVSDPPHLRRLDWVWSRVLAGAGLGYSLVASAPNWWNAEHWWRNEFGGRFALDEVIKIGYYAVAHGGEE